MFEFLFKYPATVFRKGEFLFATGWPTWTLVVLAIAASGGLGWFLYRNLGRHSVRHAVILWAFQAITVILVLWMFWQPAVAVQSLRSHQNIVGVLVDTSRSMVLGEGDNSRFEQVRAALEPALLDQLRQRFRVRLYGFDSRLSRLESLEQAVSPGNSTRLGEAVAGVLRESAALPLGALVIFSDGSDNSQSFGRELMSEIRSRRVPVHTVGVGRERIPDDIQLSAVSLPERALPKSRLSAQVTVRHAGDRQRNAKITVRDGARILASKPVTLRPGEPVQAESVDFNVGDSGIRSLRFTLEGPPEETLPGNNSLTRVVHVPNARRRVLYIDGEPRWEYKFLRRAVHNDPGVELVTMLRTTPNKFYRQGVSSEDELAEGFPQKPEDLFRYHALIIGGIESAFFSPGQQELIREFVNRRGGSLLMLAGSRGLADGGWGASRVAEILPAKLPQGNRQTFFREPAPVELTAHGRESLICRLDEDPVANERLWEELPPVADYQIIGGLKPAAVSLANLRLGSERHPLLVRQNYGRGKSLILATAGTWRWKMRLPHDDTRHHTFWRQMLRAMVSNSPATLALSAGRSVYADDPRVTLRAEVRNQSYQLANNARVIATVAPETGDPMEVELHPSPDERGIYEAQLTAAATGSYRAEAKAYLGARLIGSEVVHFRREDGIAEDFQPEQNRELLETLAEQTGGRYWTLDQVPDLPKEIQFSEAGITSREIMDIWDMPILFLLLIGLRGSEWLLRRRWGTV